jgi:hypothetical protein
MNLPKLLFCFAILALVVLLFSSPTRSFADTYSIQPLDKDAMSLYGMDDLGHIVFLRVDSSPCGPTAITCYETIPGGNQFDYSSVAPTFAWDFAAANCSSLQLPLEPCTVSDNGRTAVIAVGQPADSLSVYSGSNPPQLLQTGFFVRFAINGVGDVVFDDGFADEWYLAKDLDPVPEPTSILLLGTGAMALAGMVTRRRGTPILR